MTIPEPPIQADDTQPNNTLSTTMTPQSWSTWALGGVILFSLIALLAMMGMVFSGNPATETELNGASVILRVEGEQEELRSTAQTVAELLQAENITVGENDALVPPAETVLSEGMVITVARARTVTLDVNGDSQTIETPHENPAEILTQADVQVDDSDHVWVDGTLATLSELAAWTVPANSIRVQHAYDIVITDENGESRLQTTASTVGDALYEAGISVYLTDTVVPDVDTALTDDLVISIERARPITINVDDTVLESRVQGETVADALAESGIALIGLDYTIPALTDMVTPDTTITVLRVTEDIATSDTTIPYETVYQADAAMNLDQQAVIQAGQNGIERLTERIRYENGVEVSREPISTEVVQALQNQIIAYGTNVVLQTVNTPEGPREYWRVIRAYATSYHPEALGGDNVTAIGATLQHGIIASNPNIIPYRTNLYVPGYGIGMMADTGGARSSPYWVDLGYSDDDFVGWHEYVDVYLLTPVPAEIDYLLPNYRPLSSVPDNG